MAFVGNLLATRAGDLCYLDFGMMSEAPQNARYAIIAHVVHLVNRDYQVGWINHPHAEVMPNQAAQNHLRLRRIGHLHAEHHAYIRHHDQELERWGLNYISSIGGTTDVFG